MREFFGLGMMGANFYYNVLLDFDNRNKKKQRVYLLTRLWTFACLKCNITFIWL